jgi:hypothetical protein
MDLPAALHRQRSSAAQSDPGAILLQPGARCLVRPGTDAPRMGDVPWLPVAVLRQRDWRQPLLQLLQTELGRSRVKADSETTSSCAIADRQPARSSVAAESVLIQPFPAAES